MGKEPEEQKTAITNIKTVYQSREIIIKLFDNYSKIVPEVKCKTKDGEGSKILTIKQML